MCKQPSQDLVMNVIDYGQYDRKPNTTTTTRQVTKEVYGPDGKLVEKIVETTTDTVTNTSSRPYVTWNDNGPIGMETKYAGGTSVVNLTVPDSDPITIKQALDLMDQDYRR